MRKQSQLTGEPSSASPKLGQPVKATIPKPQAVNTPRHTPSAPSLRHQVRPPQSVQRKMSDDQPQPAASGRANQAPKAPPAYRPQTVPKVLQRKTACGVPSTAALSGAANRPTVAPPVYRPQPVPKVLQAKKNVGLTGNPSTQTRAAQAKTAPVNRRQPGRISPRQMSAQRPPVIQRASEPKKPLKVRDVNDVTNLLNTKIGAQSWAFTGSFALNVWASSMGETSRDPGDIDVVVAADKFISAVDALMSAGCTPKDFPGPSTDHVHFTNIKLDVLKAGSRLGSMNNVQEVFGMRLVGIDALKQQKQDINEAWETEDDDRKKAKHDLDVIKRLGH